VIVRPGSLLLIIALGTSVACAPRVVHARHSLPAAVQIDLARIPRIWIPGFVVNDSDVVDLNEETVRLLRDRLRSVAAARVVNAPAITIPTEDVFGRRAYWRRLAEEQGFPLIVTGSVKLLVAPPTMVQRGRRTAFVHASGRILTTTVVFIDGRTGAVMRTEHLPRRQRYGVGRFSSGPWLYYDLMDRALPDWLNAISVTSRLKHDVNSGGVL
jgi:hypothetical protein